VVKHVLYFIAVAEHEYASVPLCLESMAFFRQTNAICGHVL
jgi:hypothetical protein